MGGRPTPNKAQAVQARKARAWYSWILDFVTAWPYKENNTPQKEAEEEGGGERGEARRIASSNIRHEVWSVEGMLQCRRCARTFGKADLPTSSCYETCSGTAVGRALAALTGNVNYVWADFARPAIELIKMGAHMVRASRVPEVAVDWRQLESFTETPEGRQA